MKTEDDYKAEILEAAASSHAGRPGCGWHVQHLARRLLELDRLESTRQDDWTAALRATVEAKIGIRKASHEQS